MFRSTADAPAGAELLDRIKPVFLAGPAATSRKLHMFFLSRGSQIRAWPL
jgi:hypothetical protein